MTWNRYPFQGHPQVCNDADEFIAQLSANISPVVENMPPSTHVFRGHSKDSYKLIPTALRSRNIDPRSFGIFSKYTELGEVNNEMDLLRAEARSISRFVTQCNRSGLALPHINNRELERQLSAGHIHNLAFKIPNTARVTQGEYYQWPPDDLMPILGIMQHYGVPTRLLDWSWSPLVAAYFAASGVVTDEDNAERICIWALEIDHILQYTSMDPAREGADQSGQWISRRFPFRIINPRSNYNANMLRQQGLFTVKISEQNYAIPDGADRAQKAYDVAKTFYDDVSEFHDQLLDHFESLGDSKLPAHTDDSRTPKAFALFLEHKHCKELLVRLRKLGYSGSRMYEGFEGAVKGMNEI